MLNVEKFVRMSVWKIEKLYNKQEEIRKGICEVDKIIKSVPNAQGLWSFDPYFDKKDRLSKDWIHNWEKLCLVVDGLKYLEVIDSDGVTPNRVAEYLIKNKNNLDLTNLPIVIESVD